MVNLLRECIYTADKTKILKSFPSACISNGFRFEHARQVEEICEKRKSCQQNRPTDIKESEK